MHIVDGVLSTPVLAAGIITTVLGTTLGLRSISDEKLSQAAVLAACFFVASLIHIPLGPSSVHLIFNGLLGLLLGWAAFPVVLIGLILQAVFFLDLAALLCLASTASILRCRLSLRVLLLSPGCAACHQR